MVAWRSAVLCACSRGETTRRHSHWRIRIRGVRPTSRAQRCVRESSTQKRASWPRVDARARRIHRTPLRSYLRTRSPSAHSPAPSRHIAERLLVHISASHGASKAPRARCWPQSRRCYVAIVVIGGALILAILPRILQPPLLVLVHGTLKRFRPQPAAGTQKASAYRSAPRRPDGVPADQGVVM